MISLGHYNTLTEQIHSSIFSFFQGYISVELSPVAAVSVQLFSGDVELHVSGPIEISLSLPDGGGLQTSNVVPAWFFNRTTGEYRTAAYSNQSLSSCRSVEY